MKEALFKKLSELADIPGAPGHEQQVLREMRDRLEPLADSIEVDNLGNVYARKKGAHPGPTVMIAAHADQIAATVKHIDEDGFLRFEKTGGILDSLLAGRKVLVDGHFGVVGTKAGHYQTAEERKKVIPSEELYIDVGAASREDVVEMGIGIGDQITYLSPVERFSNEDLVCGGAIDDRLGCAVLLQVMERIQDVSCAGELVAVVTVQEEVGLKGARVSSYRVNPDVMIALDTIPCGGTPDVSDDLINTEIGRGPIFAVVTGRGGSGLIVPPAVRELLVNAAESRDEPYQLMVFSAGNNDASAARLVREGIPAGSVTLPRRYSHSPVEVADLNDAEAAVNILVGVVEDMEDRELSFI
jgi:endoglucanase